MYFDFVERIVRLAAFDDALIRRVAAVCRVDATSEVRRSRATTKIKQPRTENRDRCANALSTHCSLAGEKSWQLVCGTTHVRRLTQSYYIDSSERVACPSLGKSSRAVSRHERREANLIGIFHASAVAAAFLVNVSYQFFFPGGLSVGRYRDVRRTFVVVRGW